jgi:hypothetical protein
MGKVKYTSGFERCYMRWIFALLAVMFACSPVADLTDTDSSTETVDVTDVQIDDKADYTAFVEVQIDEFEPELSEFDLVELTPDNLDPNCQPGDGCFMDNCSDNSDCLSGWCVEHMGDGICSQFCQEECPQGWSCKQVAGTDPDLVFVCVSDHANLCKPCATSDNCKGVGGADDVCVDYGTEGSFCGGSCLGNEDCPWGFDCAEVNTVDGIPLMQCIAEAGICPCTPKSVTLGLWTPCTNDNDFGTCGGKRICTEEGLSDCDAGYATEEICNGLDDDCDQEVDEPNTHDGKYFELCDDNNECTADTCDGADGCTHDPLSEGECKDGDSCTVGDHCEAGICAGSPVVCDDSNPCTDDSCDGLGGCSFEFNNSDCDDEDPCTVADECNEGLCAGYEVACDCEVDADCSALEDGDLCNGSLVCNTTQIPYQCVIDTDSIVTCPAVEDDDAACNENACNPATGLCSVVGANNGYACDDGDQCTVGESCTDGACSGSVPVVCNDSNDCTDDSCEAATGCQFVPNSSACNDGDDCTVGDSCENGDCIPGQAIACDDSNVCTDDSCVAGVGCQHSPADGNCDDGNACTESDTCANGKCTPGAQLNCNDDNICTFDSCDSVLGCTYELSEATCDDNNVCTVGESCANGTCQGGENLLCNDNNSCTADTCDANIGCQFVAVEAECNDGNACTLDDHCLDGKCIATQVSDCDDSNICTTDICQPGQGCVHMLNEAPCEDDDVCTTGDHCHLGTCLSSGQLTCNDSNACTDDSCAPATGCVFTPNNIDCNDGNACSLDDKCVNGACTPGGLLACDDSNPCTDDYCDFVLGCVHPNNSAPCNDADACTANEFCSEGTCGGGVSIVCDDSNICTDDSCNVQSGCIFAANIIMCDDSLACTTGDLCSDGACTPSGPTDCDDTNVCTDDSCIEPGGCTNTPVADNTPCGNEMICMAGICDIACEPDTHTFSYTGGVQTYEVPACATQLSVEVWGAQGGGYGSDSYAGKGGYAKGSMDLVGGHIFHVYVGGKGGQSGSTASAGWNGGGGHSGSNGDTVGGGGASDIRWGGQNLSHRIAVAGGGGGSAVCYNTSAVGGNGGGLSGQQGGHSNNSPSGMGGGGTQNSGGSAGNFSGSASPGSLGTGGAARNTNSGCGGAGAGGGGYYGGGGGAHGGGGGGGSSYLGSLTNTTTQTGIRSGHGQVLISWE